MKWIWVLVATALVGSACGRAADTPDFSAASTSTTLVETTTGPTTSAERLVTQTPTSASTSIPETPSTSAAPDLSPGPPQLLAVVEPEWIDRWYVEMSANFAPNVFAFSGSGDGNRWTLGIPGGSILWDLTNGAIYLIEDTANAVLSSGSSIADGDASSCSIDALESCVFEYVGGSQLVDTTSGDLYSLASARPFLSGDGTAVWSAWLPAGLDGEVILWPNGQTTELVDLSERLGLDPDPTLRPRLVAVSPDGGSALYAPLTEDAAVTPWLAVLAPTGEVVPVLPVGDAAFAGGAVFSADGATVLFGTSRGMSVFDLIEGRLVAEGVTCDSGATWIRHERAAIALEPGRWIVALTPPNLVSGADLIVAIVEPLNGTCDMLATIRDPGSEGRNLHLLGGGSSRVGIRLIGSIDQSIIIDLDERPAGASLVYESGAWSQRP